VPVLRFRFARRVRWPLPVPAANRNRGIGFSLLSSRWVYSPNVAFAPAACDLDNARRFTQ